MKTARQIVDEATASFKRQYGFKRFRKCEHIAKVGVCTHWLQNLSSTDSKGSIALYLQSQVPAVEEILWRGSEWPFNGERWHVTLSVEYASVIGQYVEGHPADYTNLEYADRFLGPTVELYDEIVRRASTLRGALDLVCERKWVYCQRHVRDRVVQIAKDLLATLPADELDALPDVTGNLDK